MASGLKLKVLVFAGKDYEKREAREMDISNLSNGMA